MLKVTLIALGKLKEKYLTEAVKEYTKRLSRYCSLNICELEPVRLPDNPSENEISTALQKESEMIFKKIPENSRVFALCIEGNELDSISFSAEIKRASDMGNSLTFIIGSSYGLSENVKKKADFKLSVSKMTFPHQLFRVMLLEQIYRGFKINEGSAYHK